MAFCMQRISYSGRWEQILFDVTFEATKNALALDSVMIHREGKQPPYKKQNFWQSASEGKLAIRLLLVGPDSRGKFKLPSIMRLSSLVVLLSVTALSFTHTMEAGVVSLDDRPSLHGKQIGSHCTQSSECLSSYCGQFRCSKQVHLGKSCYKSQGCLSGSCVDAICVPRVGQGLLQSRCNRSKQCTSGYCEHGFCGTKERAGGTCYKDVSSQDTKDDF